jgi:hypothetical protein
MSDDIVALLKVHGYFAGVSDEVLKEVLQHGKVSHYPAGSVVHEANVPLTTVGFVLRGRLKAVRIDSRGTESLFRMIERGEHERRCGNIVRPLAGLSHLQEVFGRRNIDRLCLSATHSAT